MNDQKLLTAGIIGTLVAAICCFTPALVLLLGALGLSVFVPGLDLVFLPLLALSLVVLAVALIKRHRRLSGPAKSP
ncbi:MAG: mercury resistance system transport protein MerF [Rhodospirillales bacterium]|nr:mercury resistance system transport protein MerF [Rhodospirillales bacterium]